MSNKILYYPKTAPGDIQTIHPDGGGLIMRKDFKALVGETDNNVIDNLNENFFRGTINAAPNNMSGIWVYGQASNPISNNINIGNENKTSLISQNQTPVQQPPPSSDCDNIGAIINDSTTLDIYKDSQFERLVLAYAEHENAYSTPNWQTYNSSPSYPNGTADLEWGQYGSGQPNITEQRKYVYNKYWSTNENIENDFNLKSYSGDIEDLKKLMIYTLPIGIRPYALVLNYNAGDHISRILNAVYKLTNGSIGLSYIQTTNITPGNFQENEENLLNANGATYKREENGSLIYETDQNGNKVKAIIRFSDTINKQGRADYFINNYDEIINEYNKNKDLFLSTLKEASDNFYKRLVEFRYDQNKWKKDKKLKFSSRWIDKKTKLSQFYKEYITLAQKLSENTKACDNKNIIPSKTKSITNPSVSTDGKIDDETRPTYIKTETTVSNDVKQEIIKTPISSTSNQTGVNSSKTEDKNNLILEQVINDESSSGTSSEEGLFAVDFDKLPNRENKFNPDLYYPEGQLDEQTSPSEEDYQIDDIIYTNISNEGSKITRGTSGTIQIGAGSGGNNKGGGGQGKQPGSYAIGILESSGAIQDDEILNKVMTLKDGASNVMELALRQNPSNLPGNKIINPSVPKFLKSTKCKDDPVKQNPILVGIGNIMGPYNGIFGRKALFCASGISFSFIVFNSTRDQLNKKSKNNSGGFPCSTSSYIVPSKQFTGAKETFIYNVDFSTSTGAMTDSGLQKFEKIKQYKGAIFTVGTSGSGHIGLILYITKVSDKSGDKYDFFTLEWNVSGGDLKFLHRRFGDDWGGRIGNKATNIYIGDTSSFTGGSYAPNGLGNDYNLTGIGSVFALCRDNFPRQGGIITTSA